MSQLVYPTDFLNGRAITMRVCSILLCFSSTQHKINSDVMSILAVLKWDKFYTWMEE